MRNSIRPLDKIVILTDCNGDHLESCGPFATLELAKEWVNLREKESPDIDFTIYSLQNPNDFWTDPEDVPC